MQFLIVLTSVLAAAFAAPNPLLLHDDAVTSSVRVAVGDAIIRAEDQTRLVLENGLARSAIVPHTPIVTSGIVPAVSTVHSRVLTSDIIPTVSAVVPTVSHVRSSVLTSDVIPTVSAVVPTVSHVRSSVLTSDIIPTVSAVRTSVLTPEVIPTVRSGLLTHSVLSPTVSSVVSPVATVGVTRNLVHGVRSLVSGIHGSSFVF